MDRLSKREILKRMEKTYEDFLSTVEDKKWYWDFSKVPKELFSRLIVSIYPGVCAIPRTFLHEKFKLALIDLIDILFMYIEYLEVTNKKQQNKIFDDWVTRK
ncbi:MAG: hypothetical protein J7L15_03015 [Clostridiales bacterium]|nr:hypothetical protein [Clostridiales bacterium]